MSMPEAAGHAEPGTSPIARLLASDMREELLVILREILAPSAGTGRLAYSPDEAAEALGISRELVNDLLRTGQLGSVKAGRRRLIGRHHLEAFLERDRSARPGVD
jgi:excisionase family DNA binding protein